MYKNNWICIFPQVFILSTAMGRYGYNVFLTVLCLCNHEMPTLGKIFILRQFGKFRQNPRWWFSTVPNSLNIWLIVWLMGTRQFSNLQKCVLFACRLSKDGEVITIGKKVKPQKSRTGFFVKSISRKNHYTMHSSSIIYLLFFSLDKTLLQLHAGLKFTYIRP